MIDSMVTFKWRPLAGYRSTFGARQVNTVASMARRHLPGLKKFICVTDDRTGINADIDIVDLWNDFKHLRNPSWHAGPSCYRRLKIFSEEFGKIAGDRFVCTDLDIVFTGDLRPLFDRTEDFVIWNPENSVVKYCAALMLVRAGALHRMYQDFDPNMSPQITAGKGAGFKGSDQGWISYWTHTHSRLPAVWTRADGVYDYRNHLVRREMVRQIGLPEDARAVIFCGKPDPWDSAAMLRAPWINEHYR